MSLSCRSLLLLAALTLGGLSAATAAEQNHLRSHGSPSEDSSSTSARVIVKYRSSASVLSASGTKSALSAGASAAGPQLASTMGARLGLTLGNGRSISPTSQVLTASGMSSRVLAEKLSADSDVEWAAVDYRRYTTGTYTPNDPLYADSQTSTTPVAGQWYLRAPTSSVTSSIDVETAWAITQGSSSIVVAVLDTGILKTHPDLSSKLVSGYDFVSNTSVANDGDGRDDDPTDPGDWVTSSESSASGTLNGCTVEDSSWHGTQTASLIGAATNNSVGMAGVAPNVMLMPVRVLGKCGGYDSDIQAAMRWAAGLSGTGITAPTTAAKVINLSLGGSGSCGSYQSVVTELVNAGVVVVAAAGNDGTAVGVPANCSGVIAVAGLRHSGTKVGYSDLGSAVAISAPAGNCVNSSGTCVYPIITATNTGTTSASTNTYSDGSNYSVGTSFAAPLVSGTAALMLSANSKLTPGEVTTLLKSSARAFPTTGADSSVSACQTPGSTAQTSECYCTTSTCGAGMLDTGAAVAAAQAAGAPTPVLSASASIMLVGESITLDASSSTAQGSRTVASYLWQISSGSSYASFSSSTTAASTTLLGAAAGTVVITLTVTDSSGYSASTSKSITVAAGKPTASFTASATSVTVGSTVTLNGSASSAQGSASLSSYLWEITDGTSLASFSGSTTGSSATLSATAAGSVTVRLTVTDSNGYTGSSSQTLTITSASGSSSSSSSSSGGGGGALTPLWGLGLLLLALLLGRRRKRGV